tara:strand:+ start:123 stop:356 length:234 start_codon:yes stop_codon:yes gene_type:complete
MITNMFYTFSLDKQNIIKYGLGLKNNVFTLNIPVENTTDTIPLKIEVNNINEFKIKKIFVSNVINDKDKLLQLRNNN